MAAAAVGRLVGLGFNRDLIKFLALNGRISDEERAPRVGRTFFRNVLPIPFVELDFGCHGLANQLLRILRSKRSITAKKHVGDDSKCGVNVR
jgi:hypothetical protein